MDRDIEEIDEQKTWEGTRKRKRKKSQESNGVVKARKKTWKIIQNLREKEIITTKNKIEPQSIVH